VFDPGAREVLTHGGMVNPFSTAFFASSPAPISTEGFDVLVHDVIAAITTLPCFSAPLIPSPLSAAATGAAVFAADFGLMSEGRAFWNDSPACESTTRS